MRRSLEKDQTITMKNVPRQWTNRWARGAFLEIHVLKAGEIEWGAKGAGMPDECGDRTREAGVGGEQGK